MAQRGRPGLSAEQKRELWGRWKAGESLSEIGRALGKQPGSIHGVVASNGGDVPARRCRSLRVLSFTEREEISRGLAEGVPLRKELTAHLRTRRTMRRSRHATTKGQGRARITDAISIRERPAEAEDRAVPGHWEGDLLAGAANTHIATLVECQSRYLLLVKVDGKDTKTVVDALATQVQTLPVQLRASLTWDRGMELAEHKRFTVATDVAVSFCDPRSPWQRGTNENTNGLLRQYFPKQTDLSVFTQVDLDAIAARLNTRPRKTLEYQTPADRLAAVVASTL